MEALSTMVSKCPLPLLLLGCMARAGLHAVLITCTGLSSLWHSLHNKQQAGASWQEKALALVEQFCTAVIVYCG